MSWQSIAGWFDFNQLYDTAVAQAPNGARFVEVGAWLGRSTAYMGQRIVESGKRISFDAVDTWDGGTDAPENSILRVELAKQTEPIYDQFIRNMEACGLKETVRPVRCDSPKAAEGYEDGSLDFVFIDGDHTQAKVAADLEAWWPKVKVGGRMAGHDIIQPGVEAAVQSFCQSKGLSYYRENWSWVVEKNQVKPAKILLGIPHPGHILTKTALVAMSHPSGTPGVSVQVTVHQTSLLAAGFNYLWSLGLAGDYTHFAMLHADIEPDWNWLDIMLVELERTGADLISAVAPIKDARGITSTGIGHPDIWWSPKRRLTMQEIMRLPSTFTAEDAGYPDHALLINTGCWLADLSNPKWRETDADGSLKVYFNIRDRIVKNGAGSYIGHTQSEDWFFSVRMHEQGLKAVATRKVQLGHYSDFAWPNYAPWGKWDQDHDTAPHWRGNGQKQNR